MGNKEEEKKKQLEEGGKGRMKKYKDLQILWKKWINQCLMGILRTLSIWIHFRNSESLRPH